MVGLGLSGDARTSPSLGAAVVLVPLLGAASTSDAFRAKTRPTCLGKRATIVGTPRADVLPGSRRANVIVGLGGQDRIDGRGGNDLICGGAGADVLAGGVGTDALDGGAAFDVCRSAERRLRCEEMRDAPAEGPLAAGEYLTELFRPRLSFTLVSGGWSAPNGEQPRHLLLLRRREPGALALAFDSGAAGESVAATIARLSSIPSTRANAPTPVVVGGASGQRIDVVSDDQVTVPGLAEHYELEPTDAVRIYAVDVGGRTLTIIIEAPESELASFAADAEQVLATVQFG